MLIKFISLIFILLITLYSKSYSSDEEENKINYLQSLPKELIVMVAENLEGDDFLNLKSTSKEVYNIIDQIQEFKLPNEDKCLIEYIYKNSLDPLTTFFSRIPKKILIPRLRTLLSEERDHADFYHTEPDYKLLKYNFNVYIKITELRKTLLDNLAEEELLSVYYHKVDHLTRIEEKYSRKPLETLKKRILFNYKQVALVNEDMRKRLIYYYENGCSYISIDHNKAKKWKEYSQ